mmetsp:Transcript_148919/g.478475  ORF Transcript_148919/g.478475 Transcript_148919/m.478475 type:complete len:920 (+) Transcript_148919:159-2918(+)
MVLPRRICSRITGCFTKAFKVIRSVYSDSPFAFALVLSIVFLVLLIGGLFSKTLAQFIGSQGVVAVDLGLVWLFGRLVARSLLFPGSVFLFQRNQEASFRAEMARQYCHVLRQLWNFARHAARQSEGMLLRGVSADGILRGIMVIEMLTATFRMQQQQHGVKLSKEQLEIERLAQDIERWLKAAQVRRAGGPSSAGAPVPLIDWLKHQNSVGGGHQVPQLSMTASAQQVLMSVELAGEASEATRAMEGMEQLLFTLDELRQHNHGVWKTAMRFLRVPAVGSLNQLRAELQMRYGGHRCWVTTRSGHKIDAMFIPCDGPAGAGGVEDEGSSESAPLKANSSSSRALSGPTVVWCNPNAAYYETMVYQGVWLNFWLSRGINILFFNYSGYGRSSGLPSPSKISEDGDAIIAYLKGKGITDIAIYGRSIGGVTACHLARKHPDVVKLLIADRTMSQLQTAAKHLYGGWAAKGLQITRMTHSNVDNFCGVSCYKVLVVDPKDTMILELAALRSAVAQRAVETMRPEERLVIDDSVLQRLAEVWSFFQTLYAVCESEDDGPDGHDAPRRARDPVFRHDVHLTTPESRSGASESSTLTPGVACGAGGERVSASWLQDNAVVVRQTMGPLVDQIRSMLDIVGEQVEAGGTSLNDALLDNHNAPVEALRCLLANMQVWGTLGDHHGQYEHAGSPPSSSRGLTGAPGEVSDREVELFLRKDFANEILLQREVGSADRFMEMLRDLRPERISAYHRRLARTRVAQARKELRRRMAALQSAIAGAGDLGARGGGEGGGDAEQVERLLRSVQAQLAEVESFVNTLCRFFKSVDLALPFSRQKGQQSGDGMASPDVTTQSDSSDEKLADIVADGKLGSLTPQPSIDHAVAGYIMHLDCGHNGLMDEVECRQLALHLRSARFGRAAPCGGDLL